jgi:hypothetical protein
MNVRNQVVAYAAGLLSVLAAAGGAEEAKITVAAGQVRQRVSHYLTGACIEDVNHEIYGGVYSQMIFGESFQEPAKSAPVEGFRAYGGAWTIKDGELSAGGGDGPKLVSEHPAFADGEAGVDVLLPDRRSGNAGLIVKVSRPDVGADNFDGYEVSLDAAANILRLGRHRYNWELIKDTPCEVPVNRWVALVVKMTGRTLEVLVDGKSVIQYDAGERALGNGTVGLRQWQREARYRNLRVTTAGTAKVLPFKPSADEGLAVSGMWQVVRRGGALGPCELTTERPFVGAQGQRITFINGEGEIGIENRGLNRWGMYFVAGRPYEGCIWARAEKPADLFVAMESGDGARVYAQARLSVTSSDWQRLDFTLTPSDTNEVGRFAIALREPGSVTLGYAFLQPGEWGRFKALPVRRDVAKALIDEGITVLRYGGSMINDPEYRWKNMIGPRDRRPPYHGTWYPYSSNGWGILDFINFCQAAGFLAVPAFNMGESPRDMADFIEYVNGPAESEWGRRRAADGHPESYRLKYLELGNEERVDEDYWRKFKPLAEGIWAKDPEIVIVVGDFIYAKPIEDPFNFTGAASGITSLAAQQKILELARQHGREVWFEVHIGTDGPGVSQELLALPTYVEALDKISGGARHKVAVFEFNAGNHQHRRALANALAIHAIERISERLPVACSANCLQCDGQNDNGWDQGLLFLNPSRVWLQPPGYVTRMISRNYLPLLVKTEVQGAGDKLDVSATRSEDARTLVLQVVNLSDLSVSARIQLEGFMPSIPTVTVEELSGPLDAVNTAENPSRIMPRQTEWRHQFASGNVRYSFSPHSFTILRFQ